MIDSMFFSSPVLSQASTWCSLFGKQIKFQLYSGLVFAPRTPARRCFWSFTIPVIRNLFHFDWVLGHFVPFFVFPLLFKVIYFPFSALNLWCIFAELLFVLSLLCYQIFLRSKQDFSLLVVIFFFLIGCFYFFSMFRSWLMSGLKGLTSWVFEVFLLVPTVSPTSFGNLVEILLQVPEACKPSHDIKMKSLVKIICMFLPTSLFV